MRVSAKKVLKYGLACLLIPAVIVALGFISFTGMLVLCGIVGVAIGSFVLTGMIEGEVYAQSILHGLEKLFKGKWFESEYLKRAIYVRELNLLLKDKAKVRQSRFLQAYKKLAEELAVLQEQKERLGVLYFFSGAFKQKFEKAEKRLQDGQKYFIDLVDVSQESAGARQGDPLLQDLDVVFPLGKRVEISEEIDKKHAISPWCLAAGVCAGVGMGLVFFSVGPESIVAAAAFFGVALSASAFPVGVTVAIVILAVIAAMGYTVLIYNTLTDMLQNDAVRNWINNVREFFSSPKETLIIKIVATIGVALLVGLCIFATITTAGTWWYAAKAGVNFILPRLQSFAALLSTPFVIVMGIAQLGFNLYNSLKSVRIAKSFVKFIKNLSIESIKNKYYQSSFYKKNYAEKETLKSRVNPFRFLSGIIELPARFLFFLGHVAASAVMGDRFEPIPAEACVVPGAIVEITADMPFFVDEGHDHEHSEKHKEKKAERSGSRTLVEDPEESALKKDKDHKEHEHAHEEHSHSHTDIPGKILLVVLSPLYLLSFMWDFCCSLSELPVWSREEISKAAEKSFIKSFFGIEAFEILTEVKKDAVDSLEDSERKIFSAHKIHKKLVDPNKSASFSEGEKTFFKDLRAQLCNTQSQLAYANIFNNANSNGEIDNFSEPAQVLFAKVSVY